MAKIHFSSNVFVRGGKIVRLSPMDLETVPDKQVQTIRAVRSLLHTWLGTHIEENSELNNSRISIHGSFVGSTSKLTVDFKVKSVSLLDSSGSTRVLSN